MLYMQSLYYARIILLNKKNITNQSVFNINRINNDFLKIYLIYFEHLNMYNRSDNFKNNNITNIILSCEMVG